MNMFDEEGRKSIPEATTGKGRAPSFDKKKSSSPSKSPRKNVGAAKAWDILFDKNDPEKPFHKNEINVEVMLNNQPEIR